MRFFWEISTPNHKTIKQTLLTLGVARRLLSAIKHGHGAVLANGKKRQLSYVIARPTTLGVILDETPDTLAASKPLPEVVYDDANWLVVNKAAHVLAVPSAKNSQTTLINQMKGYLTENGQSQVKLHLLSRLDRDTSGVVIAAKHRLAQGMYDQSQTHKYYLAVVCKRTQPAGTITLPIKPSPKAGDVRQIVAKDGKPAKTSYYTLAQNDVASLVLVRLYTGRTHQIRVHFQALNHPLIGDELYGKKSPLITRQALHAVAATFVDPLVDVKVTQGKKQLYQPNHDQRICVNAALPKDMQELLKKLNLTLPNDWDSHFAAL